ncbi:MAG: hypothetical protein JNG84_11250 [Archangium sp.]|nr:hypothetical protein [Archangium sp.]
MFRLDNATSREVDAALRHDGAAAAGTSTRGVGRGLGARAEFPGVAAEVVAREGMAEPLRCAETAAESRAASARDALLVSDAADARVVSLRDDPAELSRRELSRAMSPRDAPDELPVGEGDRVASLRDTPAELSRRELSRAMSPRDAADELPVGGGDRVASLRDAPAALSRRELSRAMSLRDAPNELPVGEGDRVASLRDAPVALSRCEVSRCKPARAMSLRDAADGLPGIDDADDALVSCADVDPARAVSRDVLSALFLSEDDTGRVPSARDAATGLLRCDGAGPARGGSPRELRAEDDRTGSLDAAEATRAFTASRSAAVPGRASAGSVRLRVSSAAANAVSDFDFLAGERAIPQLRQPAP